MPDSVIFIVDDDEGIRTSLSRALLVRGYNTQTFASAREFLEAYSSDSAGCLILDYGMPEVSGLELQQMLVQRRISIPIIFITGHGGVSEAVQAMKHGAVDFLEKPFRQDTLISRIETALELDLKTRQEEGESKSAQIRFDRMTQREREIAQFLASNPSQSSSKDVARHLGISHRTVDHHRARIFEKMGVSSVAELVEVALASKLFERSGE